jgi:putative SOS response-associated peptidase YedK
MCYYLGIEVKKDTFIHLKDLKVQVKNHDLIRPVMSGFEYDTWPIILPAAEGRELELSLAHWELIPGWINSQEELVASRKKFNTLNATAERLLESRIYQSAALKRRCLILASGFYEWRHFIPAGTKKSIAFPYYITLTHQPYFFIAGIWQDWTDKASGETLPCFSLVTTAANSLMSAIHHTKKRMPSILPEEQAYQWLQPDLSKEEIARLAAFSIQSNQLSATAIHKDFRTSSNPTEPFQYDELPELTTQ